MAWIVKGKKTFSIVGNSNATKYSEIFPLIQKNSLWLGATANTTDMVFAVPKGSPITEADMAKAERLGYPSDDERQYTRLGNSCWFTNIDHGRRHSPLQLMTMAENIKFSRHKSIRGVGYQKYANFDAIEVGFSDAIPSDYEGVMGVPITFLDKYNPDQFEILGTSLQLGAPMSEIAEKGSYPVGGPNFYLSNGDGTYRRTYERIAIRKRVMK